MQAPPVQHAPPQEGLRASITKGPDGVTLVSSTVVNQMAFANNHGIPLAALVDFIPPAALQLPQVSRQPARCTACSAFINAYCMKDLTKGVWKCSLCGQANEHKQLADQSGSLPELSREAIEFVYPAPPAPAKAFEPGHVVVTVDATLEDHMLRGLVDGVCEGLTALDPETRISVVTFDGSVQIHDLTPDEAAPAPAPPAAAGPTGGPPLAPLGSPGPVAAPPPFSVTLPGSRVPEPALLQAYLDGSVLGPGGRRPRLVAPLRTCLARVREVLRTVRALEPDVPLAQRPRCLAVAVDVALGLLHVSAPEGCCSAANGGGEGQPAGPAHHYAVGEGGAAAGASAGPGGGGGGGGGGEARPAGPVRLPRGSRVLLVAAGPSTVGPGSLGLAALQAAAGFSSKVAAQLSREQQRQVAEAAKYTEHLVAAAVGQRSPVDVVLVGDLMVNAPQMVSLARDTQGLLLPHRGCGPCFGPALRAAFGRCFGTSALLDCFVSDGLRLVQWLGPVDVLQNPDPEDLGLAVAHDRRVSGGACSVVRLQEGHGAALRLEVVRSIDAPAVLVQIVLQFVDSSIGGRLVQRVITRRLPVVSSLAEYMQGVNAEAAAVVVAKKAVLDAKKAGALWNQAKAEELRYSLRAQLTLIASRCGKEVTLSGGLLGWGVKKARQWPTQLLPLAQALYQLQRSVLLGPASLTGGASLEAADHVASSGASSSSSHPDAQMLTTQLLLTAGSKAALMAIVPKLYRWRGRGLGLQELPPVDILPTLMYEAPEPLPSAAPAHGAPLGASGGSVLLLNQGTSVLAIPTRCLHPLGAAPGPHPPSHPARPSPSPIALAPADLDDLKRQVLALGSGVWPAPELRLLGPEAVREMQAQLLPVAKSSLDEVRALHPALMNLMAQEDLVRLKSHAALQGHADITFVQWCQGAGVLVLQQD